MIQRILIIRLSALGDVIFALPALDLLRRLYSGAEVSWVVEDKAASILVHRPDLAEVIVYPRKTISPDLRRPHRWPRLVARLARHVNALRRHRYDLILDFQGNLKSGLHTIAARGGERRGFTRRYVKEMNHLFTNRRIRPPDGAIHRIEKNAALVKPDFAPGDLRRPELYLPEALTAGAEASLDALFPAGRPRLVVHPGTSAFGAFKRWAPERFGALAKRMGETRGLDTLVTWGPGEEDLADRVVAASGAFARKSPPSTSLSHLAAFIRTGRAYVSADSGPLHLANYLGVPCLALFGPKDPALYRPYFPPARVVRSDVPCGPCTNRRCDDPICMKRLETEIVGDALDALLDETEG